MAKTRSRVIDVEVTARAQRQDAELAMGSDPLNAIIELVTNADDAYMALGSPRRSKIKIAVERHRKMPTRITVSDRAGGMTQDELVERLGAVGRRTSGFEVGAERRGLFGRGAKDIVHFGRAEWESVKDGKCNYFRLIYDGRFTGQAEVGELPLPEDRKQGTVATLSVEPRFAVPQHDNLLRKLRNHFALRPILCDERREVLLVDASRDHTQKVRFTAPKATQLLREILPIPGYSGHAVELTLSLSEEPLADEREENEYWRHSILITSGRAAYAVFDGGRFSRDPYSFHLRRLSGHASVPGIGDLIREFDDAEDAASTMDQKNPLRLVRRDRRGLVSRRDHPFIDALYSVLETALEPHIERLRKASEEAVGRIDERTRRKWNQAGAALARLMEDEEGEGEGSVGKLPPIGLALVPQVRIVEPEENARILVRYRPAEVEPAAASNPQVGIVETDENNATVEETMELRDRGGFFSGTYMVSGQRRVDGEVVHLAAKIGVEEASSLVEWRERVEPPIDRLQFQHATFLIKDGQERHVALLAPWDLVAMRDDDVRLAITGDSSITLPGGLSDRFGYDEKRGVGICRIPVRGQGVGSRARLVAVFAGQEAEAELRVTTAGVAGIKVELEASKIPQRARMEAGTLFVNTQDRSVSRYLGPKNKNYPGQHSVPFNVLLAEIMVENASRSVLLRATETLSPAELFGRHAEQMRKWLPRIHAVLVSTADLDANRQE